MGGQAVHDRRPVLAESPRGRRGRAIKPRHAAGVSTSPLPRLPVGSALRASRTSRSPSPSPSRGVLDRRAVRRALGDPWLILGVLLLFAGGCAAVYAATANGLRSQGRAPTSYLERDLINGAIAVPLAAFATRVNLRVLTQVAPALYGLLILALLLVLSPVGADINGAHAWFRLGFVELEPSELVKLLLIVLGAALLGERPDALSGAEGRPPARDVWRLLALTTVPLALVLAEPALGVAIILVIVVFTLLALGGLSGRGLLGLLAGAGAVVALAVSLHVVKPYQEARFTAFINPTSASAGATGYHLQQSLTAIGGGGVYGQGFLDGSQTNGGFVPEQQTDFIFTVVGEESGFLGSGALLAVFSLIVMRGLRIASEAADPVDRLVAVGVSGWLAVQGFINIAMTVGLAPVTGLPLPFVSYGGSALFASALGVGLLLNVARRDG